MKHATLAILVCATVGLAASVAVAGSPPDQPQPTRAEIQQKAMQEGPATSQIGYHTYKEPVVHHPQQPVNPKLMKPLSQREIGMLFNACVAYPECKIAYAQAHERYQAQLRAKAAAEVEQQ